MREEGGRGLCAKGIEGTTRNAEMSVRCGEDLKGPRAPSSPSHRLLPAQSSTSSLASLPRRPRKPKTAACSLRRRGEPRRIEIRRAVSFVVTTCTPCECKLTHVHAAHPLPPRSTRTRLSVLFCSTLLPLYAQHSVASAHASLHAHAHTEKRERGERCPHCQRQRVRLSFPLLSLARLLFAPTARKNVCVHTCLCLSRTLCVYVCLPICVPPSPPPRSSNDTRGRMQSSALR